MSIEQEARDQGTTIELQQALGVDYVEGALSAKDQVYVVIVVPPPPQSPRDLAAAAGSSPSGRLQETHEVVVRESDREGGRVTLRNGDILRLDENETMEVKSGGIALLVLKYKVVERAVITEAAP